MPEFNRHSSMGRLAKTATDDSLIQKTIEFVWQSLEPWRNDPDRKKEDSEEALNASFHDFLQARARHEFSMIFFQHEQRQEGRRRVDLSVKPVDRAIIQGITYTKYTPFIVIEGKRLPAPGKSREREYVTGDPKMSGGIQRFKSGLHGKEHKTVILLAYLQQGSPSKWLEIVNSWIIELSKSDPEGWSKDEKLQREEPTASESCMRSASVHPRVEGCVSPEVAIKHFWIDLENRKLRRQAGGTVD